MGLMDMLGGLFGKKTPNTGNGLLNSLLPMLIGGGALGGLAGLVSKFTSAGLGSKTSSWVGTGENESVHPDEVESALGSDTVAKLASDAGVSHEEAKSGLASMLPGLVSGLTPGGSLPTGDISKLLKGFDFKSLLGSLGK